MNSHTNNWR